MKKIVLKSEIDCEKCKRKALQAISQIQGVDSVKIDLKEKRITVIGEVDPVLLTRKLRKRRNTELLSVGPAKEEEKGRRWAYVDFAHPADQTKSCHHCEGLSAFSDENPNACSIS